MVGATFGVVAASILLVKDYVCTSTWVGATFSVVAAATSAICSIGKRTSSTWEGATFGVVAATTKDY